MSFASALHCGGADEEAWHTNGVVAACVRRRSAEARRREAGELPPVEIRVPSIALGHVAFDRVCGNCHPRAEADIGPRIVGRGFTEERVRMQVRWGGGMMSAVPDTCLPDDDLDAVVLYLRSIRSVQ